MAILGARMCFVWENKLHRAFLRLEWKTIWGLVNHMQEVMVEPLMNTRPQE